MGNISQMICSQYEIDLKGDQLIQMFEFANNSSLKDQRYHSLLKNHRETLKEMLRERKTNKKVIEDVDVQILPYPHRYLQNFAQLMQLEMKLIVSTNLDQSQKSKTVLDNKQSQSSFQGCIIYPNAYFCGQILDGKANGFGTLYMQEIDAHQIVGYWLNDQLKNGKIYKITQENSIKTQKLIFDMQIINGQKQAIIKVEDQFIYRGSIQLAGSTKYADILTGQGVIHYMNGDKYIGPLVKGLYQTGQGKIAQFRYVQGEFLSFKGSYKCGLKDDIGVFQLQLQGEKLSLHITFAQGIPLETGLVRLEDGSEYSIRVTNEGLFVQSRIQFI